MERSIDRGFIHRTWEIAVHNPLARISIGVVTFSSMLYAGDRYHLVNLHNFPPSASTPAPVGGRYLDPSTLTPEDTLTPTATETIIAVLNTKTVEPTDTPTPINTVTLTPTPLKIRTATAVRVTPSPTETAKPEKNPWPTYGVYSGLLSDEKGQKIGMIELAFVPRENKSDQLFLFYQQDDGTFNSLMLDMQNVKTGHFEFANPDMGHIAKAGTFIIQGNLDTNNHIIGKFITNSMFGGTLRQQIKPFEVSFRGTKKAIAISEAQKINSEERTPHTNPDKINIEPLLDINTGYPPYLP